MEQASLNIGTIGQRLEAARQAKGVSVSEAGRATKILSKFIEAMESDDFGALSAPVYAKSFIRMYAQYLGVDASPLVDEYVAQHAPRNKTTMTDEVRQNLAKADRLPVDSGSVSEPSSSAPKSNRAKAVFGDVNEAIAGLSSSGLPIKLIVSVVGGLILIAIIVLSATQCSDEEAEPSTASGAASIEHATIEDGVPNAYLAKPGVVEVDRN
ncbi:helix-turn-helix transcriptional regulator [Pontiellaceae bacterium B1224]|nr:helix-turn-helix transcriptional regulator [Pontiellaceae bacterium B1224]